MLRLFHVARSYPGVDVLVDVSLTVERGDLVVLSGAAGSGKTTLLRLLLGLERPNRGWITLDGFTLLGASSAALAEHRRRLAIIPQRPILIPERTALANVALALEVQGAEAALAKREAAKVLDRLGGHAIAERAVARLSPGEQRLVSMARALVRRDVALLLGDNLFSELDVAVALPLGELLEERRQAGAAVLLTNRTPGPSGLGRHRTVLLEQGRVAFDTSEFESKGELGDDWRDEAGHAL